MTSLKTLTLEHLPTDCLVNIALFKHVRNAEFLHSQLLARNPEFQYAFIDASVVVSSRQILAAVYKAVNARLGGYLRTPNVHSETVVSLNPSPNIAESYRRYGISRDTKNVLVVKVLLASDEAQPEQVWQHLTTHVEGTAVEPTDEHISSLTDWAKIRKFYKLNGLPWLDKMSEAQKQRESELLVIGAMALRGV